MEPEQPQQPSLNDQPKMRFSRLRLGLILLALLVVAAGVWGGIRKVDTDNDNADDTTEVAAESALVSVNDKAFEPATVKIKVGQGVTWTNDGKKNHQIASDPHPTDDALPELNDDIPLEPGDSFSYVFDEAGTYTYHDELNPLEIVGTVIVE